MAKSQTLLARLLNTPDLPAIVPHLHPDVLHRVIQTCGLEDCAELVVHATPAQLARVFDLDLWRSRAPGRDERFAAERFGVWLTVLADAGPEVAADKLARLDLDLVAGGFAQHIAAFDRAAVAPYTTLDGEQMPGRASKCGHTAEIGGYLIEARRMSAWDEIVEVLASLATERPAYFHRLMRACVRLSDGAREEDASHTLLQDAEQHMFDLASERDGRREEQGYVTPAQAQAFLRSALDLKLDGDPPGPSALARAYFRAFDSMPPESPPSETPEARDAPVETVLEVLRDAGVLAPPPRALFAPADSVRSRFMWIETYVASHPESPEDLAYLANVILAGCSVQGRPFTQREAGDAVVATCNLGLENWPSHWPDRDVVTAFQVGWTILRRDVCICSATRLIAILAGLVLADRNTRLSVDWLRRDLIRHVAEGEPWRARAALDVILELDAASWASLLGLIDVYPVLHAALSAGRRGARTIDPGDVMFISQNSDIVVVQGFLAELPSILAG
jgi:Family of unknown function (DUF6178)